MKKLCIIIHLYYTDLWDEINSYLKNVYCEYDLHISLTKDKVDENSKFIEKIKHLKNIYIYKVDNIGLDIGPFLYVFNEIVNKNMKYDLMLKIHTKKGLHGNRPKSIGERWRKQLIHPILKDKSTTKNIIEMFNNDSSVGIVGSKLWLVDRNHPGFYYNIKYIKEFIKYFDFKTEYKDIKFIGGTIFWSKFNVFENFFKTHNMMEVYKILEEGAFTDSHSPKKTHAMERIISMIMIENGKKVIGI